VSAVAAVAAAADVPLLVIPAGTRNHFARDLGLNTRNPARAPEVLVDGQPTHIDLRQRGGSGHYAGLSTWSAARSRCGTPARTCRPGSTLNP